MKPLKCFYPRPYSCSILHAKHAWSHEKSLLYSSLYSFSLKKIPLTENAFFSTDGFVPHSQSQPQPDIKSLTAGLWGNCTSLSRPDSRLLSKSESKVVDLLSSSFKSQRSLQRIGQFFVNQAIELVTSVLSARLRITPRSLIIADSSNLHGSSKTFQLVGSASGHETTRGVPSDRGYILLRYNSQWFSPRRSYGEEIDETKLTHTIQTKDISESAPWKLDACTSKIFASLDTKDLPYTSNVIYSKFTKKAAMSPAHSLETLDLDLSSLPFKDGNAASHGGHLKDASVYWCKMQPEKFGFSVQHSRPDYEKSKSNTTELIKSGTVRPRKVYIALGSNLGSRISIIESACRELSQRGIKITRTSALYETKPMYVLEQEPFINGVCEAETNLHPIQLLDTLQSVEKCLGRKKTIDKGPRSIDLDILLFDNQVYEHDRLSIPHKAMLDREFVLRPLCDLIPEQTHPSSPHSTTYKKYLNSLPRSSSAPSPLTPISLRLAPITASLPSRSTHVMAILNLTPDSFSDGGLHASQPTALLSTLHSFFLAGTTILDVGGQSTRPVAPQVTADEELSRILSTIKYIRSNTSFDNLAISVDTYRASVASAAIESGADIVNDVSAGAMDPEMLPTVAKLGCTIILMHMRGNPSTMGQLTDYPSGVVAGVATELLRRVLAAEAAGIFRWRIMLDPGIGFAKTQSQNLELLRRFDELRNWEGLRGLPWCVGASRKGFIRKVTGVKEPKEAIWGTAATVAAAVQGGADVIRVHDVKEMAAVVKMADAIWRIEKGSD